jgi:hypothetical protein
MGWIVALILAVVIVIQNHQRIADAVGRLAGGGQAK